MFLHAGPCNAHSCHVYQMDGWMDVPYNTRFIKSLIGNLITIVFLHAGPCKAQLQGYQCDATTIDSAKSQQLVVGVFYFLT